MAHAAGVRLSNGIKGEVERQELEAAQRVVVRRSAESRATVPHLELEVQVAMERALALLAREVGPTFGGSGLLAARACALALRDHPRANAAYRDGAREGYSRVNLGLVLTHADIQVIPTVLDADRKPLAELAQEVAELRERARSRELTSPELSGATCSFWDAGVLGIDRAGPVIVAPHAAALAAGAVREVAAPGNGSVVFSAQMTLTLACDHRILYGEPAASFLIAVKTRLEEATL